VLDGYEDVYVDGELKLRHPQLAEEYTKALAKWMKKKEAGEARAAKAEESSSLQQASIAA
jgi:hypothetical protein